MHIFYCEQPGNSEFLLDTNESGHLVKVLRLKKGDHVLVINGTGSLYKCAVVDPDHKQSRLEIIETTINYSIRDYKLHLAIAPTKNIDRFEIFIEKAVEFGIDEITPLITARSERRRVKRERLERIIIAAMKQSIKTTKTTLNETIAFDDFINIKRDGVQMIAHCNKPEPTATVQSLYKRGNSATFLIGPEGDFSEEEVLKSKKTGFIPITLGQSRLRTETAGIAACSLIYFINQDAI
jgi:16S rRNA (uracil1498-N3)-methyltransferase